MRHVSGLILLIVWVYALSACMASSTSSDGVNCGPSEEKPIWERPLACQGR
jgi:hypothetical protein